MDMDFYGTYLGINFLVKRARSSDCCSSLSLTTESSRRWVVNPRPPKLKVQKHLTSFHPGQDYKEMNFSTLSHVVPLPWGTAEPPHLTCSDFARRGGKKNQSNTQSTNKPTPN